MQRCSQSLRLHSPQRFSITFRGHSLDLTPICTSTRADLRTSISASPSNQASLHLKYRRLRTKHNSSNSVMLGVWRVLSPFPSVRPPFSCSSSATSDQPNLNRSSHSSRPQDAFLPKRTAGSRPRRAPPTAASTICSPVFRTRATCSGGSPSRPTLRLSGLRSACTRSASTNSTGRSVAMRGISFYEKSPSRSN